MSDRIKSVLTKCGPRLVEDLSADKVLTLLSSEQIISDQENEEIKAERVRHKQVDTLLDILKRK